MAKLAQISIKMMFLLFACVTQAATYYVDQGHVSAVDTNPGSESMPWKTIQKAANIMVAGDTVFVKQGVYTELTSSGPSSDITGLKPINSGTAGNYISYEAYPGHVVIIDQQSSGIGFYLFRKHFIQIKGFVIRNIKGATDISAGVMTLANSSNIIVENNHIYNIDGPGGSNAAGIRFDWVDSATARNNLIHDIVVDGVSNGNAAGILSFGMKNITIENNELYNAYSGIYHKQSAGETGALIKKNVIHDVSRAIFYDVAGGGNAPHFNQQVTQNIIYNSGDGIHMNAPDASGVNDGLKIWNNTIAVNKSAIWVQNTKNVIIYNNIVIGPISKDAIRLGDKNVTISEINYNNYNRAEKFVVNLWADNQQSFNSLSNWQSTLDYDQNSSASSPSLVAPDQHNYKLKSDSSMRGAGKDGVNIGAYINDFDVIGYTGIRPENPTALTVE